MPVSDYRNAGCLPQLTLSGDYTHNGKRQRDFGRVTGHSETDPLPFLFRSGGRGRLRLTLGALRQCPAVLIQKRRAVSVQKGVHVLL